MRHFPEFGHIAGLVFYQGHTGNIVGADRAKQHIANVPEAPTQWHNFTTN
jgi:hypothetical protein